MLGEGDVHALAVDSGVAQARSEFPEPAPVEQLTLGHDGENCSTDAAVVHDAMADGDAEPIITQGGAAADGPAVGAETADATSAALQTPEAEPDGTPVAKPVENDPATGATIVCDRADIVSFYRLALGRDPESEGAIDGNVGRPLGELVVNLLGSLEFELKVGNRLQAQLRPVDGLFSTPPDRDLVLWCAARLPLSDSGRHALRHREQNDWIDVFDALLNDPLFVRVVGQALRPSRGAVTDGLRAMKGEAAGAGLDGALEEVTPFELRGWALNTLQPSEPIAVQVYIDGVFRAAVQPDRFRRDLQDRFGGHGRYGYVVSLAAPMRSERRTVLVEVRDAATGARLGRADVAIDPPPTTAVSELRSMVVDLRAQLDRLERQIPPAVVGARTALVDYPEYASAYYTPAEDGAASPEVAAAHIGVALYAGGLSVEQVARAIEALVAQQLPMGRLALVHDAALPSSIAQDLIRRASWRLPDARCSRVEVADAKDLLSAAMEDASTPYLLFADAGALVSREAVGWMREALARRPEAALIYADEDRLAPDGVRRAEPQLRPAFDPDLWMQKPYLGSLALLSVDAARRVGGVRIEAGNCGLAELALRLHDAREPIVHTARVLCTRQTPPVVSDALWSTLVEAKLSVDDPAAVVMPHSDIFGAEVPGALTIRRPSSSTGVRASLIIPTRDRADLIGPCLDSLENARAHNRTAFEVIVIDNGSVDPAALAQLERARAGGCRVLTLDEPFNWALLNNVAADVAEGDVLVFLNDDTLVITPDWLDALVESACRDDIGAVGARLLFEDGTIQHAGLVLRDHHSYVAHEGVGEPPSSPGYMGRHALVRQVLAVTGACLATRRSVFHQVGGFDSGSLPIEGSDVDYCLRVRAAGYGVLYSPHATLHHLESKSRGFSRSGAALATATAALAVLQARWGERFPSDPFFNAHFDRVARPCAYLRPPPQAGTQHAVRKENKSSPGNEAPLSALALT